MDGESEPGNGECVVCRADIMTAVRILWLGGSLLGENVYRSRLALDDICVMNSEIVLSVWSGSRKGPTHLSFRNAEDQEERAWTRTKLFDFDDNEMPHGILLKNI